MLTSGTQLGPYAIVAPLGAGGMGEVYRARDTRLDREVAIKVLPERLANDADALARFEREAKAVAALSHPNILAIHDVGRERGISFVVTELLEGETLRERLHRSAISWRQAVEITVSIADGLAAAHAKGVIHRDLKPENIYITTAGHVKILDFGLARMEPPGQITTGHAAESTPTMTLATRPGAILGTPNYMSPEQVRGLHTDARSDIFSLGCVLYEMIAGRRPFAGDTPADTMTAILKEEPAGIAEARTGIRPELERVIVRCLEKKPEQRFQTAPDLAFTLRSLLADTGAVVTPRRVFPWYAKAGIVVLVAAALLVGAFMVRRELRLGRRDTKETIDSLAVLPFENVSRDPEQEYFVDGMTEALISDLAKIKGLKKVISRTSVMRYKATTKLLPEIARELNVDAVVEGSVLRVGERVRITAQLIHAATQENLWADSYNLDLRDVLSLHGELARTIAQEIKVTLTPQEQARMAERRPVNPDAHQAYLKGRFYWNKRSPDGLQKAIEHFGRAIELDPHYAPAHAGLADSHTHLARHGHLRPKEAFTLARQAALKAVGLDDTLAEAHGALAVIALYFDWDWSVAERELRRALDLNPSYEEAHHQFSHLLLALGRSEESLIESKRALALDPLDLILNVHLGWHYMLTRQYELAIAQLKSVLEMDPDDYQALRHIGWTYLYSERHADGIAAFEAAMKPVPDNAQAMAALATAYAAGGRGSDARELLRQLEGLSGRRYVSACDLAAVYAALNEIEVAFDWLENAYEERSPRMVELGLDPVFDPLRTDPRFTDLVRRVGLPPLPVLRGTNPPASPLDKGREEAASPLEKGGQRGVPRGKIMLAVLPFENLSRDPEQDYFSDGLTEEMISQLSRLNPRKLGVIARTSAMHYKNTTKTIDAIGRELGVAYIVEGSVRRAGERVRITAQLIAVSDQTHLWAENYERDLKDIFALQSDVAERVAESLTVELLPGAVSTSTRARPVNPEAYQAYLKGRFHWNKRTPDGLQKAVEYFQQVVSLAPDWPLGYAGLAGAYAVMPQYSSMQSSEAMPKAKAAAAKALEMDESLGEAHATMGLIANNYDWDWPTVEREYKRAIALSPNYATAHHWYALYLMHMGRFDESLKEMTKAQELDPLSLIICSVVGMAQWNAGHLEQAEIGLRKTLELGPDFSMAHINLAISLFLQGRSAQAITEAREAVRLSNNAPHHAGFLGYMCAKAGQPEEARNILDELAARSADAYVAPTHFALVHAGLDERDRMFDWLEKAYQERDAWLPNTLINPFLTNMRTDPRFADLVRRVGLPERTRQAAPMAEPDRKALPGEPP